VNEVLVAGTALAGAVTGWLLDDVSAATAPPSRISADDAKVAAAVERSAVDDPHPTPPRQPSPVEPRRSDPEKPSFVPREAARTVAALVTALLFALPAVRIGPRPELAAYCVLFAGLVAVSSMDLRVGLLPRKVLDPTFVLMVIGLLAASAVDDDWRAVAAAAIAGALAGAVFFAIRHFSRVGLGQGDVRLAGVVGVGLGWLGLPEAYLGFLVGFFVGALYGLVAMVVWRTGRRTRVAFGPALAAGTAVGVLWGGSVAHAWLHTPI
jgi:leader peptidase (prepilin peptidase)/N-methyltransferase